MSRRPDPIDATPPARAPDGGRIAEGRGRAAVSVAILAALAGIPLVIAAGFIVDRPAAVPADISPLAMRGVLDGTPAERAPAATSRAGY